MELSVCTTMYCVMCHVCISRNNSTMVGAFIQLLGCATFLFQVGTSMGSVVKNQRGKMTLGSL